MKLKFVPEILREGEGGGQGGGQQAGQQGGQGGQQGWTPPANHGLPDHVLGKNADETIGKLVPFVQSLRGELSSRGAVPKDGAYEFSFSDTAKAALNLQPDDKVMPILKTAMSKHGITDKQQGFVSDLVDGIITAGILPKPMEPNDIWKSLASDFQGGDSDKVLEGQKRQKEAITLVEAMKGQAGWDDGMVAELRMFTGSPDGLKILKAFQQAGVIKSAGAGGQGSGGDVTKEALAARQQDPRNNYQAREYDPAFHQETQRMFKQLYGE